MSESTPDRTFKAANIILLLTALGLLLALFYARSRSVYVHELLNQAHGRRSRILLAQRELGETLRAMPSSNNAAPARVTGLIRPQTPEERRHFRLVESKEADQLRIANDRINIYITWAPLFRELKLSANDELRLVTLLYDRDHIGEYINSAFLSPERKPSELDVTAVRSARQQIEASIASEIRTLLGDEKLAELNKYKDNLPVELAAAQIQQACAVVCEPLSKDQFDHIRTILSDSSRRTGGLKEAIAIGNSMDQYIDGAELRNVHVLAPGASFINHKGWISVNHPIGPALASPALLRLSSDQQRVIQAIIDKQAAESALAALPR